MAVTEGKRIVQLPSAASTAKSGVFAIVDPITDKTVQIAVQAALGATRASFAWQVGTTYAIDDIVIYNGLTTWTSLQNSNLANIPAENAFWTTEPISVADGITDTQWAAGLFTYDDSKVIYQNSAYFLQVAAPFVSSNIVTEIANGDWGTLVVVVHSHITDGWSSFSGSTSVTNWLRGFYTFESPVTPAGGQTLGTANIAYDAHVYFVLGASSTDMVIRVAGTSYDDITGRTASDTEDVDTSGGVLDDYFETTKKWIGQVNITLQNGSGVIVDYGWAAYFDNQNTEFIISAIEWNGRAGANDNAANLSLYKHAQTGWTYDGAGALIPPPITDMQTEFNTEFQLANAQHFRFKQLGINETIEGQNNEGILIGIDISANNAVSNSNIEITKTDAW